MLNVKVQSVKTKVIYTMESEFVKEFGENLFYNLRDVYVLEQSLKENTKEKNNLVPFIK
jgi:FKBP-type peptidyl-prolyl cis-trans isomerase (trigger factor)